LEDARRLAALRDQISLLDGEIVFEGWAAERLGRGDRRPGLAMLTNQRLIVADTGGGFSALPIAKIDRIDLPTATTVDLTAWYEAISLDFASAAAAATLVNSLGQNPERRAAIRPEMGQMACPPCDIAGADRGPVIPIRQASTI
jgi:hypothetical protein